MRFAIPSPPTRSFFLDKKVTDWPLACRLALIILPSALAIALAAVWFGYRAASVPLAESLHDLPMFEAKLQAATMGDTLKQLRDGLFRLARSEQRDAQHVRDNLERYFLNNSGLIREFGYKETNNGSYLLLRDGTTFTILSDSDISTSHHSPFQQITLHQLEAGKAKLYPAVFFTDPTSPAPEQHSRKAVMRMALSLPDTSATVMIGIDLEKLSARLDRLISLDSPLRLPSQADVSQLAFFFDADGWILFEMQQRQNENARYLPDTARQGYSGDLGRAGFDAAFRPWTEHENYWLMVTDALMGRSGSIPAPPNKYTSRYPGEAGILCFTPVFFASSDGIEPIPMGGIAFFETTLLPMHAFLRVANYSIIILVTALVLFTLLAWRVSRKLGRPLRLMAKQLADMNDAENLAFLDTPPAFAEQQKIQHSVNRIISTAMINLKEQERLHQEMQHTRSQQPVSLYQPLEAPSPQVICGLVGSSPLIEEVRKHVGKAAKAGTDVLVWGETGTGKELVAAAIHMAGNRSKGPYISINCGALDENLLLDALFGHVKGAFTEARDDRKGAFLSANGGTLHLDEIANSSTKVQQSLLRALSVRRILPLGSDKEIPFDTRVVAATNVDLRECVRAGTFREDLYYRLAIINIETPPLRHRKEDIPELAAHLIREAALSLGRPEARLSRGALDMITACGWPGNVRELKNCITRAMAFVEGDIILPEHIILEQDARRTYAKPPSEDILSKIIRGDTAGHIDHTIYAPPGRQEQQSANIHAPWPNNAGFLRGIANMASSLLPTGNKDKGSGNGHLSPPPQPPGQGHIPLSFHPAAYPFKKDSPSAHVYPLPPHSPADTGAPLPPLSPENGGPGIRNQPLPDGLNERQTRAITLVRSKGEFTRAQYEEVAGSDISSRTAQNDLRELVERGILQRMGAGPGTRYTLHRDQP